MHVVIPSFPAVSGVSVQGGFARPSTERVTLLAGSEGRALG